VQDCDVLVMLTSALCHDLDHPGYNNAYQVSKFPYKCMWFWFLFSWLFQVMPFEPMVT